MKTLPQAIRETRLSSREEMAKWIEGKHPELNAPSESPASMLISGFSWMETPFRVSQWVKLHDVLAAAEEEAEGATNERS